MINLVRYGFVGFTEVSIALSLLALTAATAALFAVNLRLFSRGLPAARVALSASAVTYGHIADISRQWQRGLDRGI